MFAKNSNLSKKPFDSEKSHFLHPHSHVMHHVHHSSVTKKLPSAHCLLVLLPQCEKWLVLEGLIHLPEYIRPDSTEVEIK